MRGRTSCRDAGPTIRDDDLDAAASGLADGHGHRRRRRQLRRRLDGVADHAGDRLFDQHAIGVDGGGRRRRQGDLGVGQPRLLPRQVDGRPHRVHRRERRRRDGQRTHQRAERLDRRQHLFRAGGDVLERRPIGRVEAAAIDHVGVAVDGGEAVGELVRQAAGQPGRLGDAGGARLARDVLAGRGVRRGRRRRAEHGQRAAAAAARRPADDGQRQSARREGLVGDHGGVRRIAGVDGGHGIRNGRPPAQRRAKRMAGAGAGRGRATRGRGRCSAAPPRPRPSRSARPAAPRGARRRVHRPSSTGAAGGRAPPAGTARWPRAAWIVAAANASSDSRSAPGADVAFPARRSLMMAKTRHATRANSPIERPISGSSGVVVTDRTTGTRPPAARRPGWRRAPRARGRCRTAARSAGRPGPATSSRRRPGRRCTS